MIMVTVTSATVFPPAGQVGNLSVEGSSRNLNFNGRNRHPLHFPAVSQEFSMDFKAMMEPGEPERSPASRGSSGIFRPPVGNSNEKPSMLRPAMPAVSSAGKSATRPGRPTSFADFRKSKQPSDLTTPRSGSSGTSLGSGGSELASLMPTSEGSAPDESVSSYAPSLASGGVAICSEEASLPSGVTRKAPEISAGDASAPKPPSSERPEPQKQSDESPVPQTQGSVEKVFAVPDPQPKQQGEMGSVTRSQGAVELSKTDSKPRVAEPPAAKSADLAAKPLSQQESEGLNAVLQQTSTERVDQAAHGSDAGDGSQRKSGAERKPVHPGSAVPGRRQENAEQAAASSSKAMTDSHENQKNGRADGQIASAGTSAHEHTPAARTDSVQSSSAHPVSAAATGDVLDSTPLVQSRKPDATTPSLGGLRPNLEAAETASISAAVESVEGCESQAQQRADGAALVIEATHVIQTTDRVGDERVQAHEVARGGLMDAVDDTTHMGDGERAESIQNTSEGIEHDQSRSEERQDPRSVEEEEEEEEEEHVKEIRRGVRMALDGISIAVATGFDATKDLDSNSQGALSAASSPLDVDTALSSPLTQAGAGGSRPMSASVGARREAQLHVEVMIEFCTSSRTGRFIPTPDDRRFVTGYTLRGSKDVFQNAYEKLRKVLESGRVLPRGMITVRSNEECGDLLSTLALTHPSSAEAFKPTNSPSKPTNSPSAQPPAVSDAGGQDRLPPPSIFPHPPPAPKAPPRFPRIGAFEVYARPFPSAPATLLFSRFACGRFPSEDDVTRLLALHIHRASERRLQAATDFTLSAFPFLLSLPLSSPAPSRSSASPITSERLVPSSMLASPTASPPLRRLPSPPSSAPSSPWFGQQNPSSTRFASASPGSRPASASSKKHTFRRIQGAMQPGTALLPVFRPVRTPKTNKIRTPRPLPAVTDTPASVRSFVREAGRTEYMSARLSQSNDAEENQRKAVKEGSVAAMFELAGSEVGACLDVLDLQRADDQDVTSVDVVFSVWSVRVSARSVVEALLQSLSSKESPLVRACKLFDLSLSHVADNAHPPAFLSCVVVQPPLSSSISHIDQSSSSALDQQDASKAPSPALLSPQFVRELRAVVAASASIRSDILQPTTHAVTSRCSDSHVVVFKISSLRLARTGTSRPPTAPERIANTICTAFRERPFPSANGSDDTPTTASSVSSQVLSLSYTLGRPPAAVPGLSARMRVRVVSCWQEFVAERAMLTSLVLPAVRWLLQADDVRVTWEDRPWTAQDESDDEDGEESRESDGDQTGSRCALAVEREEAKAMQAVERLRELEESYCGYDREQGSTCVIALVGMRGGEVVQSEGKVVQRCVEAGFVSVGHDGVAGSEIGKNVLRMELEMAVGSDVWAEGVRRLRDEVRGGLRGRTGKGEVVQRAMAAVDLLGNDGEALDRTGIVQARLQLTELLKSNGREKQSTALGARGSLGARNTANSTETVILDGERIETVKQVAREDVSGGTASMRIRREQHIRQVGELVARTVADEGLRAELEVCVGAAAEALMSTTATASEVQGKAQRVLGLMGSGNDNGKVTGVGGKLLRQLLQVDDLLLANDSSAEHESIGSISSQQSVGEAFRKEHTMPLTSLVPTVPMTMVWALIDELASRLEVGHGQSGVVLRVLADSEQRLERRVRRRACQLLVSQASSGEGFDIVGLADALSAEVMRQRPCGAAEHEEGEVQEGSGQRERERRGLREDFVRLLGEIGVTKLIQGAYLSPVGPEHSAEMSVDFNMAGEEDEARGRAGGDQEQAMLRELAGKMLRLRQLRGLRSAMVFGSNRASQRHAVARPSVSRIFVRGSSITRHPDFVHDVPEPVRTMLGLEESSNQQSQERVRGLAPMVRGGECWGWCRGGCRECAGDKAAVRAEAARGFRRELIDPGSTWCDHVTVYEQAYAGFDRADGWVRIQFSRLCVDSEEAQWAVTGPLRVTVRVGASSRSWRVPAGAVQDMAVPVEGGEDEGVRAAELAEARDWISLQVVGGRVRGVLGLGQEQSGVAECDVGLGEVDVEVTHRNGESGEEEGVMGQRVDLLELLPVARQRIERGNTCSPRNVRGQPAGQRRRVWVHDGVEAASLMPADVRRPDRGELEECDASQLKLRLWQWVAAMTVDHPTAAGRSQTEKINSEDFLNILVHSLIIPDYLSRADATQIFRTENRSQLLLDREPVMGRAGLQSCVERVGDKIGLEAMVGVLMQYESTQFEEWWERARRDARPPSVGVELVVQYETASVATQARGLRFEDETMGGFGRGVVQHLMRSARACIPQPLMQTNAWLVRRREEHAAWEGVLTRGGAFRVERGGPRERVLQGLVGLARRFVSGEPAEGDQPLVMLQGEGGSGRSAMMAQVAAELSSDATWWTVPDAEGESESGIPEGAGERRADGVEAVERRAVCVSCLRGCGEAYEDVLEYLTLQLLLKGVGGAAVTAASQTAYSPLSTPFSRLSDAIQQAREASGRRVILVIDGLHYNEAVHFAINFLSRAKWTTPAPLAFKACCLLSSELPDIEPTLARPWADQQFLASLPFRVPAVEEQIDDDDSELNAEAETTDEMRQRVVLEAAVWLTHKDGVLAQTLPPLSDRERWLVLHAAFSRRGVVDGALIGEVGAEVCSRPGAALPLYLEQCVRALADMPPSTARRCTPSLPAELCGPEGFVLTAIERLEAQYGVEVVSGVCLGLCRYGGTTEEEVLDGLSVVMRQYGSSTVELQEVQAVMASLRQFAPWDCGADAPPRPSPRVALRRTFHHDIQKAFVCDVSASEHLLVRSLHTPLHRALRRLAAAWPRLPSLSNPNVAPLQLQAARPLSAPSPYPLPLGRTRSDRAGAVVVRDVLHAGGAEGLGATGTLRARPGLDNLKPRSPGPGSPVGASGSGRGFWFGSGRLSTWDQDADWKSFVRTEAMLQRQYGEPSRRERFWTGGTLKRTFSWNPNL